MNGINAQLQGLTQSQLTLARLQGQFGTMQPGNLQTNRKQFYSYVAYGTGASEFNFFGDAVGSNNVNRQLTNMPVQANFGTSSFLVKAISASYFVSLNKDSSYVGTDASAWYAEIVGGFFKAGIFKFTVNAKTYMTLPFPFLYMPPGDGRTQFYSAGETEASGYDHFPFADLQAREGNLFLIDPEILIEAHTNFAAKIAYPSGTITPIVSTLTDAGMTIYIGIILDGIEFRPVQ